MEILFVSIALAAVVAAVVFYLAKRKADEASAGASEAHRSAEQQLAAARDENSRLGAQVSALARYQHVIDAEAEARRIVADAHEVHAQAERGAKACAAHAQQEASAMRADASAAANALLQEAETVRAESHASAASTVSQAQSQAHAIIDAANTRAHEIAGEAYAAAQNAKQLERTVQALKNVIEGYGDKYIVPTFGLLDELGEHFSFADAGQRLKTARQRTKDLIAQGHAASCDYVEANRRETAIAFVLDAFNGKVDTILASVKDDNFGTLRQKIVDAFDLVNFHGQPFRNARIEPGYRDARIEELRSAVVAMELRNREREEQRALKEKIREEERAQKEFERVQKVQRLVA